MSSQTRVRVRVDRREPASSGTVIPRLTAIESNFAAHETAADPHTQYSAASMDINAGSVNLLTKHRMMADDVESRKVGRLGVGTGKAVIALRFDDYQNAMRTTVVPLLQARGLPYSNALISGFSTEQPWGVGTTWEDVKGWVARGCEIWSHGWDHKDYLGYAGLVRNVVTTKAEIEAQGLRVQGFSLPGVTPVYTEQQRGSAYPYDRLQTWDDWHSPAGHLLMQTYPLVETYSGGIWADIGQGVRYGRSHRTIDQYTLANAQTLIDDAIRHKVSMRIMCHAGLLGTGGSYMSVADYTSWLDYLVSKWDAGLLDVVTPSSLPFVDQSNSRMDLLKGNGGFAGLSQSSQGVWNNLGTNNTVYQTGGPDNGPYLEIPSSGGVGPNARPYQLSDRGCIGETFLFEGWCKSLGAGTTTARVVIKGYPDSSQFNVDLSFSGVGNSTWVLRRVPFTIPMFDPAGQPTDTILIQPHRNGGDACGWANLRVIKV